MKIISNGFRITDICPQVDGIEVDGDQMVRITFILLDDPMVQRTDRMSVRDFNAFAEAVLTVHDRLNPDPTPPDATCPQAVIDRAGDEWVWRDDHNGYVLAMNDHDKGDCPGDCGGSLRWIEQNWGPVKPKP